jgi:hypothetical protein
VADGFPREGCIASDLRPEFWTLGHKLFRDDASSFPVPFVAGDAFTDALLPPTALPTDPHADAPPVMATLAESGSLAPLYGRVSVIHASSFFHLFDEALQAELVRRLAPLLSPEPGSMMLGSHGGLPQKGQRSSAQGGGMFCHGPDSWRELWEGVYGKNKVKVEAHIVEQNRRDLGQEGAWHLLVWCVTRL